MLILSPTRELAVQTYEVLTSFKGPNSNFEVAVLYGGASRESQVRIECSKNKVVIIFIGCSYKALQYMNYQFQIRSARQGMDICIATPGRCLDLLRERVFSLKKCSFLVLDEADRMLDMGFYPQIQQIISEIEVCLSVYLHIFIYLYIDMYLCIVNVVILFKSSQHSVFIDHQ